MNSSQMLGKTFATYGRSNIGTGTYTLWTLHPNPLNISILRDIQASPP